MISEFGYNPYLNLWPISPPSQRAMDGLRDGADSVAAGLVVASSRTPTIALIATSCGFRQPLVERAREVTSGHPRPRGSTRVCEKLTRMA
jgi:hypothetical protein